MPATVDGSAGQLGSGGGTLISAKANATAPGMDATFDIPHLQVQGPRSRELLAACTDADVESLRYFRFIPDPVTICGVEGCWLARTGYGSANIGAEEGSAPCGLGVGRWWRR